MVINLTVKYPFRNRILNLFGFRNVGEQNKWNFPSVVPFYSAGQPKSKSVITSFQTEEVTWPVQRVASPTSTAQYRRLTHKTVIPELVQWRDPLECECWMLESSTGDTFNPFTFLEVLKGLVWWNFHRKKGRAEHIKTERLEKRLLLLCETFPPFKHHENIRFSVKLDVIWNSEMIQTSGGSIGVKQIVWPRRRWCVKKAMIRWWAKSENNVIRAFFRFLYRSRRCSALISPRNQDPLTWPILPENVTFSVSGGAKSRCVGDDDDTRCRLW